MLDQVGKDFGNFSFCSDRVGSGVFFGGFQYSFLILLSVMAIEFISTSLKESLLQQLSARKLLRGWSKIVTLALVSVCHF